ncbi:MAG TPA: hypothetical protein VE868_06030, partial [Balneolaceae bacterium]|nr:hypothetical protein [Balneolaceae bacterium]
MKKFQFFLISSFLIFGALSSKLKAQISPAKKYGKLFVQVQMSGIFNDSKTFVDAVARKPPDEIMRKYKAEKNRAG